MKKHRFSLALRIGLAATLVIIVCFLVQALTAKDRIKDNVSEYYDTTGTVTVRYLAALLYDRSFTDDETAFDRFLESAERVCNETEISWIAIEPMSENGDYYYIGFLIDKRGSQSFPMPAYDNERDWFWIEDSERFLSKPGTIMKEWYTLDQKDKDVLQAMELDNEDIRPADNDYIIFSHGVMDSSGNMTAIARVWFSTREVFEKQNRELMMTVGVGLAISIVMLVLLMLYIYFRVLKPIGKISETMAGFVNGAELGQEKISYRGNNEIGEMAQSYNTMTDNIRTYVAEIDTMARVQEEMNAELKVASQIQQGMLPEGGYSDGYVSANATMKPARYVGGDFYDYFRLDDGRVCAVIADVSGKGVSAALFMSSAVMMIRYIARTGITPAKILEKVNSDLCRNNPELLFITAFIAIYDPKDGTLTCANAGHNPPYLVGSGLVRLDGGAGMVLGTFDGEKYEDTVLSVSEGSALLMYTDGVTEAVNAEREQYGETRLESALSGAAFSGEAAADAVIAAVSDDLAAFSGDTEQFDDVTMLCMYFKGNKSNS